LSGRLNGESRGARLSLRFVSTAPGEEATVEFGTDSWSKDTVGTKFPVGVRVLRLLLSSIVGIGEAYTRGVGFTESETRRKASVRLHSRRKVRAFLYELSLSLKLLKYILIISMYINILDNSLVFKEL
jgi:hypothetical protein